MTRGGARAVFVWLALAMAACGSVQLARTTQDSSPSRDHPTSGRLQIAQAAYGADASFVTCQPPQCPMPTQKTLAKDSAAVPERPATAPEPVQLPGLSTSGKRLRDPEPLTVIARFPVGSATLSDVAREAIDEAVAATHPLNRVRIVARTDSTGTAAFNGALARTRADAVAAHLSRRKPAPLAHIVVDARGRCCYAESNRTAAGRAANRRAEITFETDGAEL